MTLSYHDAAIILVHLKSFGPKHFSYALQRLGPNLADLFNWPPKQLVADLRLSEEMAATIHSWAHFVNLPKIYECLARLRVDFLARGEKDYPPLLETLQDPPIGLFQSGTMRSLGRAISIVGSRDCTAYGEKIAHGLATELAAAGFTIISGLARGIDLVAHRGALEGGGRTAAVLGCGVDVVYPLENRDAFEAIRQRGCLLSEFPCGTQASRQNFPIRNRIISGISEAIIVVESRSTGGSILSANCAFKQGRKVFAVPGKIDRETSRGCHDLIRQGAILVRSVDDILSELSRPDGMDLFDLPAGDRPQVPPTTTKMGRSTKQKSQASLTMAAAKAADRSLSADQVAILRWLEDRDGAAVEDLAAGLNFPPLKVAEDLQLLKIEGLVREDLAGNFSLL